MQNCEAELLSEYLGNNSMPTELFPPSSDVDVRSKYVTMTECSNEFHKPLPLFQDEKYFQMNWRVRFQNGNEAEKDLSGLSLGVILMESKQ